MLARFCSLLLAALFTIPGCKTKAIGNAERCGNGQLDRDEDCDDGNDIQGDGCNLDCRPSGLLTTEVRWDGPGNDWPNAITVDADGNAIVLATVAVDAEGTDQELLVRKYAPEGALLLVERIAIADDPNPSGRDVQVGPDGSLLVLASLFPLATQVSEAWIRRYGADGEELMTTGVTGVSAWSVLPLEGGAFVVVGNTGDDGWVGRFDAGGAVEWEQTYSTGPGSEYKLRNVLRGSDGNLTISGWDDASDPLLMVLVRYSPAGDALGTAPLPCGSTYIAAAGDDLYAAGGWFEPSAVAQVCKVDVQGNELWSVPYQPIADNHFGIQSIASGPDGSLVLVGWRYSNDPAQDGPMVIQKLDAEGNALWHDEYFGQDGEFGWGADVTVDSDGYVWMAGFDFGQGYDLVLRRYTP